MVWNLDKVALAAIFLGADMKLVWVNRFKADGSAISPNKWMRLQVNDCDNLALLCPDGWRGHLADDIEPFKESHNANLRGGNKGLAEYIGDQRGDGRFYIDDGHLPPNTRKHLVVAWFRGTGVPTIMESRHLLRNHVFIECWMPLCKKPKVMP